LKFTAAWKTGIDCEQLKKETTILNQDLNTNENELEPEKESKVSAREPVCQKSDVPLFLQEGSEGPKCDPQDEKDKSGE